MAPQTLEKAENRLENGAAVQPGGKPQAAALAGGGPEPCRGGAARCYGGAPPLRPKQSPGKPSASP